MFGARTYMYHVSDFIDVFDFRSAFVSFNPEQYYTWNYVELFVIVTVLLSIYCAIFSSLFEWHRAWLPSVFQIPQINAQNIHLNE